MKGSSVYKIFFFFMVLVMACDSEKHSTTSKGIAVSSNGRYFVTSDGQPFFWLGDTGWLLFSKLNRDEAEKYLDDRRAKGFNVIQVMVIHDVRVRNAYGDSALINRNVATPNVTEGNSFTDSIQYDYWDHVDFIVDLAATKGLYMGMVPVWGSNVKNGAVSNEQAAGYAAWLAERYKDKSNIIWLNGGDIRGDEKLEVWQTIGNTLRAKDPHHLITFHPRGRTQSSTWFHDASWLDFNMFQSGHRNYDQDTSKNELRYGPDNWRYVQVDYNKTPIKPTLDGEPSYEGIPHGLHDPSKPRWTDDDVRRYAYWSVFAGACGFTYGDNSVMQMLKPGEKSSAYGATAFWYDAINDPGSSQMIHLKNLMLSRSYAERIPDQSLIAEQGEKYDYQVATRGNDYAMIYTYNGRPVNVVMGKIAGAEVKASWYNPRNGDIQEIGTHKNEGAILLDPPGEIRDGNDWVLILDTVK